MTWKRFPVVGTSPTLFPRYMLLALPYASAAAPKDPAVLWPALCQYFCSTFKSHCVQVYVAEMSRLLARGAEESNSRHHAELIKLCESVVRPGTMGVCSTLGCSLGAVSQLLQTSWALGSQHACFEISLQFTFG